jgi:hypothetical protein
LIFLGIAPVPPNHGGTRATAYGFRIGEKQISLTVERLDHEGKA